MAQQQPGGGFLGPLFKLFKLGVLGLTGIHFLARLEIRRNRYVVELASTTEAQEADMLSKWEAKASKIPNIYLQSAHLNANGEPNVNLTKITLPTLIKCDNGIWACVNKANTPDPTLVCLNLNDNAARARLYQNLKFPDIDETRPKRQVKLRYNRGIIDDLTRNEEHIHVDRYHSHQDMRMDHRILLVRREGEPASYFIHRQNDQTGQYQTIYVPAAQVNNFHGVNLANLQFDNNGKLGKVKKWYNKFFGQQDQTLVDACVQASNARPVYPGKQQKINDDLLRKLERLNNEYLITAGAGFGAANFTTAARLLQQASGSLPYLLLNKMMYGGSRGAAPGGLPGIPAQGQGPRPQPNQPNNVPAPPNLGRRRSLP